MPDVIKYAVFFFEGSPYNTFIFYVTVIYWQSNWKYRFWNHNFLLKIILNIDSVFHHISRCFIFLTDSLDTLSLVMINLTWGQMSKDDLKPDWWAKIAHEMRYLSSLVFLCKYTSLIVSWQWWIILWNNLYCSIFILNDIFKLGFYIQAYWLINIFGNGNAVPLVQMSIIFVDKIYKWILLQCNSFCFTALLHYIFLNIGN